MNPSRRSFAVIALFASQLAFVACYVSAEHTIYYWDYSMYHAMARGLHEAFQHDFAAGMATLHQSMGNNYNMIFCLPSLLSFALFGESRLTFVLTNFVAFVVPYEIAVACVLRRVYALDWGNALLFAFGTVSLLPPAWFPLLEGYPDTGAAACIAFAAALALGQNRSWKTAAGMGLSLGLAVLLRRHFAYPAIAVFAVAAAFDFMEKRLRFLPLVKFYALCGGAMLGIMMLLAPDFVMSALTVDFNALYASYKVPTMDFLRFVAGSFGWLLIAATFGGLAVAARRISQARRAIAFVAGATVAAIVVWCHGPAEASDHYTIHILPLLASVGLTGLALVEFPYRSAILSLIFLILAADSAWALWLSPKGVSTSGLNAKIGLFAAPHPPEARKDYAEVVALGDYLAKNTKPDDKILVVGSSPIFNQDILRAVYTDILNNPAATLRFLWGPEIDGEQKPPLDVYAAATVYVVATPTQYHLDPAGQTVVTASARQFPPPAAYAHLFHVDDRTFTLNDNVTVRVWRRDKWTPAALHSALASIHEIAPPYRQDWIDMNGGARNVPATAPVVDFFLDSPLPAGDYRFGIDVLMPPQCQSPHLTLTAESADGLKLWSANFSPVIVPGSVYHPFTLTESGAFLRLSAVSSDADHNCGMRLNNARVEAVNAR